MKKLLLVIVLFSFIACHKENEPVKNNKWIEDIKYIRDELPLLHINLFAKITKEEFDTEINDLINRAPNLTESEIVVGLMKIFANIGDSHTGIANGSNLDKFQKAPLKFEVFDDGVYITDIIEQGKTFLKQKVVAINNIRVDTIRQMFNTIIPHDNEYFVKAVTSNLLRMYAILYGLDIVKGDNSYIVKLDNGNYFTVNGITSDATTFVSGYDDENLPFYKKNNNLYYWYETINDNIVYLQYNTCLNMQGYAFEDFVNDLFNQIKDKTIDKFIIDLRLNSGGSSLIINPLIDELAKHPEMVGKIYVCIGAATFSSAVLNVIDLKKRLNAVFVGEPTGGKPNSYGEVLPLNLPNTNFVVNYSTRYFANYDDDNAASFEPDFSVENYSYNSFEGVDACVEFIINH